MSNMDVDREILTPMQQVFQPPRGHDEALKRNTLLQYGEALAQYTADDLKAAWRGVRDEHKGWIWPVPGAFVAHAAKARQQRLQAVGQGKTKETKGGEAWRAWEAVRKSALAQEAARRGVCWSLKCKVLSSVPVAGISVQQLVMEHQRAAAMARNIRDGKPVFDSRRDKMVNIGPEVAVTALRLWDGILRSERETAREIGYTGAVEEEFGEEMAF